MKHILSLILSLAASTAFASPLLDALMHHRSDYALVLPKHYQRGKVHVLDISKGSKEFKGVDIYSTDALVKHSQQLRQSTHADMLVGRYLEDRNIYKRGNHYGAMEEARSVHLGQDLMVPAGTEVYAPLDGVVHSFKDNNVVADYGPTIILEHHLDNVTFYTLYGHLSRESLKGLHIGQHITQHEQIARVGKPFENGGWPEHLHFQIIDNMQGKRGNFIGVIQPSKVREYAEHCPDPNLILNIDALSGVRSRINHC